MNAQADAARAAMASGVDAIGKTLTESLDVQKEIRDGIKLINKQLKDNNTPPQQVSRDDRLDTNKPAANAPSAPQRAPAAAVSMQRKF